MVHHHRDMVAALRGRVVSTPEDCNVLGDWDVAVRTKGRR